MDKKRIFIAIDVPNELKDTLENSLEPFFNERFVRIPQRESWHITLVFCGYLNETEVEILKEIAARAVSSSHIFSLSPAKVSFAPERRPRMVWLNFTNSSEFAKLKVQLEDEIFKKQRAGFFRGFRQEKRAPLPHLTLARFEEKYFSNLRKLLPEGGIDLRKETGAFQVDSINIMESHLSRQGAEYKLVFRVDMKF